MKFEELTDEEWERIEPLLPPPTPTGRPRANDRKTLNGIFYVLTTGCKWMDMPGEYGSYVTAWRRFRRWQEECVWDTILQALRDRAYRAGLISTDSVSADSKTIQAKKGGSVQVMMGIRR
jgi:transposase